MNKDLTEIERLDLAARAESVETVLSRAVLPMVFITAIILLLALGSQASPPETLAVWTLAFILVVTVITLLLHWCYAAYGVSILNFLGAIEILKYSNDSYSHTFLASATNQFFLVWFHFNGYGWWKAAAPFVAAHEDGFDKERGKVGQWLADLKYGDRNGHVIEFSTKSFWNGYWTYRLLDLGDCWAVAKFKFRILATYRDFPESIVKSAPRTVSMNIPNFHDGHFDGLRIGPSKLVDLFLRTHEGESFILVLQEVDALTLTEVKEGDIIFDLDFRNNEQLTCSV
jgi:hypothetical protein